MIIAKTTEAIKLQGNLGEQTIQLLEASKLWWEVKKEPLFTGMGIPTESFGIIKQGNANEEKWLGTVGKQYEPYQNTQMAETIIQASVGIGSTFRGGTLKEGKKVFIQVGIEDEKIENDTVKRYLTCLNSHDGSTAIGFGSSNTVVVCQNTFYRSYGQVEKIRHTISAEARIKVVAEELRKTLLNDCELMTNYKRMTDHKLDRPLFNDIVKILFKEDATNQTKELSTAKVNQMKKFVEVTESELASHGETMWGLFNAVTFFENHERKNKGEKTMMLGTSYSNMNNSYNAIMNWIDSRTAKTILA